MCLWHTCCAGGCWGCGRSCTAGPAGKPGAAHLCAGHSPAARCGGLLAGSRWRPGGCQPGWHRAHPEVRCEQQEGREPLQHPRVLVVCSGIWELCAHVGCIPPRSMPAEPLAGSSPADADLPAQGPAVLLSAAAPGQQRQTLAAVPLGSVYPNGIPGMRVAPHNQGNPGGLACAGCMACF